LVSGVDGSADPQNAYFIAEYLGELESIFEKALIRGSEAQVDLFDEKNSAFFCNGYQEYCIR
jgi:hypothetical protein